MEKYWDRYFVFIGSVHFYQELVLWVLIALLNLSVLGFSFVLHDKAKRTQQGDLLALRVFGAKANR